MSLHLNHPPAALRSGRRAPTVATTGRPRLAGRGSATPWLRAALLALSTAFALPAPALAAPDPVTLTQAPGYFRQVVGPLKITALFDGTVQLPRSGMKGISPGQITTRVADRYVPENDTGFQTAVNAYLIQQGERVILVDAGTAQCFGPGLGQVLSNLRQAGYRPEDVNELLITHAHPDHLCGVTTPEGQAAFPNANLWISAADHDFWTGPKAGAGLPEAIQPLIKMARDAVAPYDKAGRVRRFDPAQGELIAGVRVVSTPGHTPGHSSFLFAAGPKENVLIWGDVLHYHAVQFARPQVSFEFDTQQAQAVRSRIKVLGSAADGRWWVGGAHLPFPGLGHVRRDGKAFAWVPAEYGPLPAQ